MRGDEPIARAYRETIRLYGKRNANDLLWSATAYPFADGRTVARDLRQMNERARWVRPGRAFIQIMDAAMDDIDRAMKDRMT